MQKNLKRVGILLKNIIINARRGRRSKKSFFFSFFFSTSRNVNCESEIIHFQRVP